MNSENEPEDTLAFFVGLKNAFIIMATATFIVWAVLRLWNLL